MVTRSIAKGYAAWVAIVKDKNNGLNGMTPKGTTAITFIMKKEEPKLFFFVLFTRCFFNPPLHMYHTTIVYSFHLPPNLSIAILK